MVKLSEVQEKLASYFSGDLDLPEFEDWFVQNSWGIQKLNDPKLRSLVHAVELRLSEFSSDHLSERDLRNERRWDRVGQSDQ